MKSYEEALCEIYAKADEQQRQINRRKTRFHAACAMKQKSVLILLVVALLAGSVGTIKVFGVLGPDTIPTEPPTSATEPTGPATDETKPVQERRPILGYLDDYACAKMPSDTLYYYETYGTSEKEQVVLDVPVYKEADILFSNGGLGFSLWWHDALREGEVDAPRLRRVFFSVPTNALRVRTDGTAYAFWDTDTGYRLYMFVNPEHKMFTGWPIVINKAKIPTLKDFQDIKIGDPLKKVDAIDGVAGLNEYYLVTLAEWTEKIWNKARDRYGPLYSYHYCKDGILRIEYEEDAALEGLNFVVSKITLYEDFMLENYAYPESWIGDKMPIINQKIMDIDLPVQG